MKVFIILLVAILFFVGSVATTTTEYLVSAQQLFSNNDTTTTTTTTTLASSSTVTTTSTTVPVSTTSTPIISPYQNFTTVEFTSLDDCFANNSAEIVGITVYPFDKCTDKSSNDFNISVFPTYVNSSFIRSVSYSKSSDCSVIIDDGGDNEVTTMLQVQTCFSNAFDGPALFVYFGDAPFKPLTTTTATPSTPTTTLPSSTTSNNNQTTTTTSSSVVTGTPTAVPIVSTSTTTTTTPIPQNQPNYVEFAIYNASTACKSDQEAISVYMIGKCYHHTTDKQATSFVWTCDKSSGNAIKTLFNHTGKQTCDENQNQPSQTETVSTDTCMPYTPNKRYSIIYKCVHHGNSPSSNKNNDDEEENQRKQTIYIAAGAGAAVVLLVAFTVLFLIWRNKNPASGGSEGGGRNQRFEVQMSTSRHQNDDVMYTEVRPEV